LNIFVTVGTTKFNDLIERIEIIQDQNNWLLQIADGEFIPTTKKYIHFSNEIFNLYNKADLIITHAGAGSIYRLLELNKNIIVCPNISRTDKHQKEIALFLEKNLFAQVCWNLDDLETLVNKKFKKNIYEKVNFFLMDEILDYLI